MEYVIWFNDGYRKLVWDECDLEKQSKIFDFDVNQLKQTGDLDFFSDDGDVVGGIFRDVA